jgi:hypothetical protein
MEKLTTNKYMNKLTAEEIIERLKKADVSVKAFAWGDFGKDMDEIGPWVEVDQYGGEGQGDDWYSVKHFTEHDVYIRTQGYYSSYEGTEFDNGYGDEVRPKQVMITVYE